MNIEERIASFIWNKKIPHKIYILLRTILLIGLGFIVMYPILYMFTVSIRSPKDLLDPNVIWIPKNFSIESIRTAAKALNYQDSLMNSIKFSLLGAICSVISTSFAGYAFARFKFRFKGILFGLVIFTIVVPPQITILPMFLHFKQFDFLGIGTLIGKITGTSLSVSLIETPWVIALPALSGVGIRGGILIYIFRQMFRNMPKELEDAAYTDGCGPLKAFIKVILPNAIPAYVTSFLFSLVWYWNEYLSMSLFLGGKVRTLAVSMSNFKGVLNTMRQGGGTKAVGYSMEQWIGATQAACLLYVIPILAVYIVLQKYYTESVSNTGIVG